MAQLHFAKNSKNPTACYYYHNDQIGVPRELTDEQGKLCWYANYSGWGKIKEEYDLTEDKSIHQPFRLQNQYSDEETGLHYNFFRYYEPNVGRFTQLDPIELLGGNNLYTFAINIYQFTDVLGLSSCSNRILASANKLNHKKEYGYSNTYNDLWRKNINKCNLFVHDVLLDAKVEAPQRYKFGIFLRDPI